MRPTHTFGDRHKGGRVGLCVPRRRRVWADVAQDIHICGIERTLNRHGGGAGVDRYRAAETGKFGHN